MKPTLQRHADALATTTNGGVACDAINALAKHASKGDEDAIAVLANYMLRGKVEHMRSFACARLAELADHSTAKLAAQFAKGLNDDEIRYWCILGFARTAGREAYKKLTAIARDAKAKKRSEVGPNISWSWPATAAIHWFLISRLPTEPTRRC